MNHLVSHIEVSVPLASFHYSPDGNMIGHRMKNSQSLCYSSFAVHGLDLVVV